MLQLQLLTLIWQKVLIIRQPEMCIRDRFGEEYDVATCYKWLRTFCWRFFAQHFKRSCRPDGPKVGSIAVSPRGDLRMPSDASSAVWMSELDELKAKLGL